MSRPSAARPLWIKSLRSPSKEQSTCSFLRRQRLQARLRRLLRWGPSPRSITSRAPRESSPGTFPGRPTVSMGFDGNIAWHGTPLREDVGDEARMLVDLGEKFPGLEFREDHSNVQVDAMEKIGDRDTYRVVGTRKMDFQSLTGSISTRRPDCSYGLTQPCKA